MAGVVEEEIEEDAEDMGAEEDLGEEEEEEEVEGEDLAVVEEEGAEEEEEVHSYIKLPRLSQRNKIFRKSPSLVFILEQTGQCLYLVLTEPFIVVPYLILMYNSLGNENFICSKDEEYLTFRVAFMS